MKRPSFIRALLVWIAALAALGGVFALYLRPDMMRTMADQLWACF